MSIDQREWIGAQRQEVFAEALHLPENVEEQAAQQAKFRLCLNDARYQHLWPMLERLIDS